METERLPYTLFMNTACLPVLFMNTAYGLWCVHRAQPGQGWVLRHSTGEWIQKPGWGVNVINLSYEKPPIDASTDVVTVQLRDVGPDALAA